MKGLRVMADVKEPMIYHSGRHRENFYRLLISRVYRPRFGIGNDLETNLNPLIFVF